MYGLLAKKLKHISEVKNGLSCNCLCPKCKHPLIAKNNLKNKKIAHFAHQSGKECEGAIETTLHLLAKSILQKTKRLTLPDYHFDYDPINEKSIFKESIELIFEDIVLEKQIDVGGEKITPDAIGIFRGKQLLIEFANTHFVEHEKKQKIKTLGVACIEIDLRKQLLDENSLTSFLNSNTSEKYWIVNPHMDQKYVEFKIIEYKKKKWKEQQKAIEEEKKKKEDEVKFNQYKYDRSVKILPLHNGEVINCPKKKVALSQLINSRFYSHSALKKIIDGEYWNGEIYGYMQNGKWIFLKKEKVVVFPSDDKFHNLTEKDIKENKFFYAGLLSIRSILKNSTFGDCGYCEFSFDDIYYVNKSYEICKYPDN